MDIIQIKTTRDSVCMGDDCNAPHEVLMEFDPKCDTVYDLFSRLVKYVPSMYDCEWEVMCGSKVLGRLVPDSKERYQIIPECTYIHFSELPEYEIFCRRKAFDNQLEYFERVEVLYDGSYFNLTLFREYGDIGTVLLKGATKITTMDREFAVRNSFVHRELQHYDRVLEINEFEGLRIVRIPNDMNHDTEYILIPKEKVMDELEKRAGTAL